MSIKGSSDKQLFERLITYLFENMSRGEVDVKTLASVLALSPSQLNRRVKAATGLPVSAFIMRTRLDEAKRLLVQYPVVTVNEVARRCGFADSAHFGHVFQRQEGMSPTQYANSHNDDSSDLAAFIRRQVAREAAKSDQRQKGADWK